MPFDFIRDPRWKDTDDKTKEGMISLAFQEEVESDPRWKDTPDPIKASMRAAYTDEAARFEEYQTAPEERGFASNIASRFGRGVVDAIGTVGEALSLADLEPSPVDADKSLLDTAGDAITGWSERTLAETPFLRPSKAELEGKEGFFKRGFMEAFRSIPQSASVWGMAGTGALLGGMSPIPGGAAIGGAIGGIGGLVAMFGAGTYGKEYKSAYEELSRTRPDLSETEKQEKSHKNAMWSGGFEAGTELASDAFMYLTFGTSRAITAPLKATLKNILFRTPKELAKDIGKVMAVETGSEMIAGGGQAWSRQEEGLTGPSMTEGVIESIIPSMVMSLLFGAGGAGLNRLQSKAAMSALNSEDPKLRIDAVNKMAARIDANTKDKDLAQQWHRRALETVFSRKPFDFDQKLVDFAQIKTGEEVDGANKVSRETEPDKGILDAQSGDEAIAAFNDALGPTQVDFEETTAALEEHYAEQARVQAAEAGQAGQIRKDFFGRPAAFADPNVLAQEDQAKREDIAQRQARQHGLLETPEITEEPEAPIPDRSEYWKKVRREQNLDQEAEDAEMERRVAIGRGLATGVASAAEIDALANEAATSPENDLPLPTKDQERAGNYKKAKIPGKKIGVAGMTATIENPKGSKREGVGPVETGYPEGKPWSVTLVHHYGYWDKTAGADIDESTGKPDKIDVIIGPDIGSKKGFIVDQVNPVTGKWDEHKTLVAFKDLESARAGYLANYEKGWKGLGEISELPIGEFKEWIGDGKRKKVAYASSLRVDAEQVLPGKVKGVEGEAPREEPIGQGKGGALPLGAEEGGEDLQQPKPGEPGGERVVGKKPAASWFDLGKIVAQEYTNQDKTGKTTILSPDAAIVKNTAESLGITVGDAQRAIAVYNSENPSEESKRYKDRKVPEVKPSRKPESPSETFVRLDKEKNKWAEKINKHPIGTTFSIPDNRGFGTLVGTWTRVDVAGDPFWRNEKTGDTKFISEFYVTNVGETIKLPKPSPLAEKQTELNRSKKEIERWSAILEKNPQKGVDRLRSYLASLSLGRKFNESSDAYFERRELAEFSKWANQHTKPSPPTETAGVAPEAEGEVKKYPTADRSKWYGDADYKQRGGRLVEMTPDEFLDRAKPLEIDEETRDNIDDLKSHIESGRELDPLAIYDNDKTQARNSDGRQRAIAAKELGIEKVPVIDFVQAEEAGTEAPKAKGKAPIPEPKPMANSEIIDSYYDKKSNTYYTLRRSTKSGKYGILYDSRVDNPAYRSFGSLNRNQVDRTGMDEGEAFKEWEKIRPPVTEAKQKEMIAKIDKFFAGDKDAAEKIKKEKAATKAKKKVKIKESDTVKFIPNKGEFIDPVEGIVRDIIKNTSGGIGYHIFAPAEGDPERVVRVWESQGTVEKVVAPPKPQKEKAAVAPKAPPESIGEFIKAIGYMSSSEFVGEYNDLPKNIKSAYFRKDGLPRDKIEMSLKNAGYLTENENLQRMMYDNPADFFTRRHLSISLEDRKANLTAMEKKVKADESWEQDTPPGEAEDWVQIKASEIPTGKKIPIIENQSLDGWDEYTVIEKDDFGITLQDGVTLNIGPDDLVEVRKTDLAPEETETSRPTRKPKFGEKAPRQEDLFEKPAPSLFGEEPTAKPKVKVERKKKAKTLIEQQNLFGTKQTSMFDMRGKVKDEAKGEAPKPKPEPVSDTKALKQLIAQKTDELDLALKKTKQGTKAQRQNATGRYNFLKKDLESWKAALSDAEAAEPKPPAKEQPRAKEPWEMTREEAAADYPGENYDKMLSHNAIIGNISFDELSIRSRLDSRGVKQIWAKTRAEIINEKKGAVKSAKADRASINKTKATKEYAKWRIKSGSQKALGDIKSEQEYYDSLLSVHKERVQEAISEGKPVPAEVLADYPDLKAKPEPEKDEAKGQSTKEPQVKYVKAGDIVDGRKVRSEIPNMDSIDSSIENATVLPGVYEVPMSEFDGLTGKHYSVSGTRRISELADEIAASKEINPLIVVIDKDGPYVLEGATRAEALFKSGAKSFPAKIVLDEDSLAELEEKEAASSNNLLPKSDIDDIDTEKGISDERKQYLVSERKKIKFGAPKQLGFDFTFGPKEIAMVPETIPPPAQRVTMSTSGDIHAASYVSRNASEVATLLSRISDEAQEEAYTVAVDENGTILEIHFYTRGRRSASQISPLEVAGRALNVNGIAKLYFVHNHPSRNPRASAEDVDMFGKINAIMGLRDIDAEAVILAGKSFISWQQGHAQSLRAKIVPADEKYVLPIKKRVLERTEELYERELSPVSNSTSFISTVKSRYGDLDGIMFLDSQNTDLGFLPLPHQGQSEKEGMALFISEAESINAQAAIGNFKKDSPNRQRFIGSLLKAADDIGISVFDVVLEGRSLADSGRLKGMAPAGVEIIRLREDILFSTAASKALGTDEKTVLETMIPILRKWANFPVVSVVKSESELEERIRMRIRALSKDGRVQGVYDPRDDTVYLIADNLSPDLVESVLRHEAMGHRGLRLLMGDHLNSFLDSVVKSKPSELLAQNPGLNLENQNDAREAADEWIARQVQNETLEAGLMTRLIQKFRQWLRKFIPNLKLNNAEIKAVLADIVRVVEYGVSGKQVGVNEFSQESMFQKTASKWYSQMEKHLAAKLPNKGTAAGIKKVVQTWAVKGDFKAEELQWSGLTEWLDTQEGKVTKAEILQYLAENNVKVQENVRGNINKLPEGYRIKKTIPPKAITSMVGGAGKEIYIVEDSEGKGVGSGDTKEEAISSALIALNLDTDTKFAQYQVPGGENYREVTITLPEKPRKRDLISSGLKHKIIKDQWHGDVVSFEFEGETYVASIGDGTWQEAAQARVDRLPKVFEPDRTYTGGHFPETNILVHMRTNERTGPNGERILFVEEVQSDWHQKGRDVGYRSKRETELKAKEKASGLTKQEDLELEQIELERHRTHKKGGIRVPDAPFKKSSQWSFLAMKRMVRYAAEQGMDMVAWTSGAMQVERYKEALRKAVDRIEWTKTPEGIQLVGYKGSGRYYVKETEIGETGWQAGRATWGVYDSKHKLLNILGSFDAATEWAAENESNTLGRKVVDTVEQENDLSEAIGKSMGDTIIESKDQSGFFEGDDITISDTGMAGFYDKIMPSELNKFFNKASWGKAKVGDVEISWKDYDPSKVPDPLAEDDILSDEPMQPTVMPEKRLNTITVHALPITPEMRQKALYEGMPLFQTKKAANVTTADETVRFATAQVRADLRADSMSTIETISAILKRAKPVIKGKKDLSYGGDLLASIPAFFAKGKKAIPAAEHIYDASQERMDDKAAIEHGMENVETKDGMVNTVTAMKNLSKKDFEQFQKYLIDTDRWETGFRAKNDADLGWVVRDRLDHSNVYVSKVEGPNGEFDAIEKALEFEANDLKEQGFTPEQIGAVMAVRATTNKGFEMLFAPMREIIRDAEAELIPMPQVTTFRDGKPVKINLKEAMATMGDMRGYYFPRIRQMGKYIMTAKKERSASILETFNSRKLKNPRITSLEKQGYRVTVAPSRKVGEDVFTLAGELVKTQQIVNAALERVDKESKAELSKEAIEGLHKDIENIFATALAEQISNIIRERGARAHMTRRAEKIYTGYEENPLFAIPKYIKGLSGAEAKKIMTIKMIRALTGTETTWEQFQAGNEDATYEEYRAHVKEMMISQPDQPNAFKWAMAFIKENTRNPDFADNVVGWLRGAAVAKYLSFRVFAAPLVNLTALPTSTVATLKGAGIPYAQTWRLLGGAISRYGRYRANPEKLSAEDRWIFDYIAKKGWDNAQYTSESLSVLRSSLGRGWDKVIDVGMFTFSESERLNRAATISAAYRGLKALPENEGVSRETVMDKAKQVSDNSHGVYNKGNYPYIALGGNPAAHVARMFYVFQRFSHTYLMNMKRLGFEEKDFGALAHMLLAPAVLAGAGASVLTPIIETMLRAFGIDEPEEKMYQEVGKHFGNTTENFARFGLAGLAGKGPGISIKGSLAIGIGAIPTSIKDLLGAPGSVLEDIFIDGIPMMAKGDIKKGMEKVMPTGFGNMIRAYREATEGLTTRTNMPIFYGREAVKLDPTEWFLRTLSFYPARVAKIREQQYKEYRLESKYSEKRTEIYSKYKRYFLSKDRTPQMLADLLAEVQVYNDKAREMMDDRGIYIPPITGRSIKANIKRSFRPSKRERLRGSGQTG